ncbi:MAG: DUF4160 domain-containing protein [Tannerellaceae bacterium]|jgi:hypothetical protein|nr:DUF4160 domain-containing protein [Tannerellaceae bacterium]
MPEICRFLDMLTMMFPDEHNLSHFHVRCRDFNALITLDGHVYKSNPPSATLRRALRWAEQYHEELFENWELMRTEEEAKKIEPLKK